MLKHIFQKTLAAFLAAVVLLAPLTVSAAEVNAVTVKRINGATEESIGNYEFILDEAAVGSWEAVSFVDSIEEFDPANTMNPDELFYKGNIFYSNGVVMKDFGEEPSPARWTKGCVIEDESRTVPAYEIKETGGKQYMFLEWKSGDYVFEGRKPSYYVFVKVLTSDPFDKSPVDINDIVPFTGTEGAISVTGITLFGKSVLNGAADADEDIDEDRFRDLRVSGENAGEPNVLEVGEYKAENIYTYEFNAATVFKGEGDMETAAKVMEAGRNPGLGVRSLHERGITGKGVNVAVIDQNLALTHPEYKDKLVKYYDTGTETEEGQGSMHGPAVASLLVGDSSGTAPGADLYFAAAPSWNGDAKYYADALNWIIEENKKLPDDDKIRVVSVSAAPSGAGSPFTKNNGLWDEAVAAAQAEDILVLDCRDNPATGFINGGAYDPSDPDNFELFKFGYAPYYRSSGTEEDIYVPKDYRTYAEEYFPGQESWTYCGAGGLSWGIPYAAGVFAMGWQADPSLTPDEIVTILKETAYTHESGGKIINPSAFIERIESLLNK